MTLMKENESSKRGNKVARIIGIILLVISIFFIFLNTSYGDKGLELYLYSFIDIPSFILIVLLSAGILLASGIRGKQSVLALLSKIIIPIGVVISLASAIIMLTKIEAPSILGPYIQVIFSSLIYSFIIKIVVEVMIAKSKNLFADN